MEKRYVCLSCRGTNVVEKEYAGVQRGGSGVKKWRVGVRSSQPLRVVGLNGWTLRNEIEFYGVTLECMASFLGVTDRAMFHWLSGKRKVPVNAVRLLAVLSMFPPMWVRNRLTGEVRMFHVEKWAGAQVKFKEGAEDDVAEDVG